MQENDTPLDTTNVYNFKSINQKLKEQIDADLDTIGEVDGGVDFDVFKDQNKLLELNERHAIVINRGGSTAIMTYESNGYSDKKVMSFVSVDSFLMRYCNQTMIDGGRTTELGKWWLKHAKRREYKELFFDPSKPPEVNGCLNTWQGFGVTPKKGSWHLLKKHIYEVICNKDSTKFKYMIRWMAFLFQFPETRPEVAVILKGKKGAGKGILFTELVNLCGTHGVTIANCEAFTGSFNEIFDKTIFLFADEVSWPGDKEVEGKLKSYITEPKISINAKFMKPYVIQNCLHVAMATNNDWVIPASEDERRFFINEVSEKYAKNKTSDAVRNKYFTNIHKELNSGGREAMLYDLLHINISDWHPRNDIPETSELQKQVEFSMTREQRFMKQFLVDGVFPGENKKNKYNIRTIEFGEYIDQIDSDMRKVSTHKRCNLLRSMGVTSYKSNGNLWWDFPSLKDMRQLYEKLHGPMPWSKDEEWYIKDQVKY
jgi:hypothetical protein